MEPYQQQNRGLTAIDGAMALIVVILVVQVWLLSATLDAYLAGYHDAAIPGAIVSGILFAACGALYLFVSRIEHRMEQPERTDDNMGPFDTFTAEK